MKKITLKSIDLDNFKGCRKLHVDFSENETKISGKNASGKTTIMDAFTWLLFNKDSNGNEKFQVRPLDSAGNRIDNVEIKVSADMVVAGNNVSLSKTQKQNWVKKRGTDVATLQGNVNLYEVDGYPKSESDYKDYVSGIIPEDLFKLLTSPTQFASLKWKEQRNILMRFISDVSDLELAENEEKFRDLIPDLEKAPSTDAIAKKYSKALLEWKKKQAEYPVRIDELERSMVDVDVAELELQKNALKEQIDSATQALNDNEKLNAEYEKRSNSVMELKFQIGDLERKAFSGIEQKRRELRGLIDESERDYNRARSDIHIAEIEIQNLTGKIQSLEKEKVNLQEQWRDKKKEAYPVLPEVEPLNADSLTCPTCGRLLPEEMKQKKISEYEEASKKRSSEYENKKRIFEEQKKQSLSSIVASGNLTVEKINQAKEELVAAQKNLDSGKEAVITANKQKTAAMEELNKLPNEPDMSQNQEYEALVQQVAAAEEALKQMGRTTSYRSQLQEQVRSLENELLLVNQKISSADNSAIEERIAELQKEQKETGQKVADQEKMIFLLEEFIRYKMQKISERVNEKFDLVSWKLFDLQINGGLKECCECTVNGVPYSNLNTGHRIAAGLDIIRSLSDLYQVSAPIFIDNCEAVSNGNVPEMSAQLIELYVTDDNLKVEVKK